MSQNRGGPKLSNSGLILKVSGTPFFDVLNHTVSVETHRKMKAAKNTSCATVVQQITSERLEGCLLFVIKSPQACTKGAP